MAFIGNDATPTAKVNKLIAESQGYRAKLIQFRDSVLGVNKRLLKQKEDFITQAKEIEACMNLIREEETVNKNIVANVTAILGDAKEEKA